jgi:transmembrane sensor
MSGAIRDRRVIEREAANWLARLSLGGLSGEDAAKFDAWRAEDQRHQDIFARLQGALGRVEGAGPVLRDAHARAKQAEARKRRIVGGVAAVSLLGLTWLWLPIGIFADLRSGRGEIKAVQLADGSRLWLDAQSAVDLDFTDSERRVRLLHGRAHFDVAHGPKPFIVETRGGQVEDIGTAFDVVQTPGGGSAIVTGGMVRLRAGEDALVLKQGQAASWRDGTAAMATNADELVQESQGWRRHEFSFRHRPLGDVIAELDRYSSRKLVLLNGGASRRLVDGIIRTSDIEQGIASLARSQGLVAYDLGVLIVLR